MAFLHSKVEVYVKKKNKKTSIYVHIQRIITRNNILRWANQIKDSSDIHKTSRQYNTIYIARFLWDYRFKLYVIVMIRYIGVIEISVTGLSISGVTYFETCYTYVEILLH